MDAQKHQDDREYPPHSKPGDDSITVVYDKQCPFCKSYLKLSRLQQQFEHIQLLSAREEGPIQTQLRESGYDLNEGIVVIHKDRVLYGAQAMRYLALITTRSSLFNKLVNRALSVPLIARSLYPIFKLVRKNTLLLLGRSKID